MIDIRRQLPFVLVGSGLLISSLVLAEIRHDKHAARSQAAAMAPVAATLASEPYNPYQSIVPDTPSADSAIDQVPGGG